MCHSIVYGEIIVVIIFWNTHKQEYAGVLMMSITEIVILMLVGKGGICRI